MTARMTLDTSWRDWIVRSLGQSCTHESIVSVMADNQFDARFARAIVSRLEHELSRPKRGETDKNPSVPGREALASMPAWRNSPYAVEPSRIPSANTLRVAGRKVQILSRLASPEVIVFANVLSVGECKELMERSRRKLGRSTTVDPKTGGNLTLDARTSLGTYFRLAEDAWIARIDRRLSELLSWPLEQCEGLQVLHYRVGGEYRPHHDYFRPEIPGSAVHTAKGGQRVATLVIYLNDVEDGGETIFPEVGLSIVPRRGHAVYFSYCNSDNQLDCRSLHGGAPVRQGEKWIATRWLRQQRCS